uniref:glycosyl transferase family 90 n=1 Tax=Ornithobacterium rhinotracheale TaxID=28251 RepID=UPI00129D20A7
MGEIKIQKKLKINLYLKGYKNVFLPTFKKYKNIVTTIEKSLTHEQIAKCRERIDYYCQTSISQNTANSNKIKDLKKVKNPKAYYFDLYEYARFFDQNLDLNYVFGDVIDVPDVPSIVKSRPIHGDNANSVLINLDKQRHFRWVKKDIPFANKRNILISRCGVFQKHRYDFFEKHYGNPLCDLGQVNKYEYGEQEWIKPKISIGKHLINKFILCLEGNDVASNLKWVMSSNSIAVMPEPTYETWFMEGTLKGGEHYIEIKKDYSDLEEQLNYYINHPEVCQKIIENAHAHCEQFWNKKTEDYCNLKVLEKYLNL